MTLKDLIISRIRAQGPISLADYMGECLLHPLHGYYTSKAPFGRQGDFITAPEISQMFGELLGLCLAQCWLDQGRPKPFTLAELGPGRGTLMADVIRAANGVTGFVEAAQIVLLEASDPLIDEQRSQIKASAISWIKNVDALPDQPLFLIANEFFDALPIRQFQRSGPGWRERQIGVDGDALIFGLGPQGPQPALRHRLQDTRDGDVIEDCPGASPIIDAITRRIERHGGAGIIIDYGDWRSLGDTLQAVKAHKHTDPLSDAGHADLTAHVDFEALCRASQSAHTRLSPQGVFLERLGITQRAQVLADSLHDDALQTHIAAHRRLTHPEEMGNLFKVIGFYPHGGPPPPGLET